MKQSLHTKLDQLALRLSELDATLAAPDAARDLDRYRALTKEHAEIAPVVARFRDYTAAEHDAAAADELAQDPSMRDFADEERAAAQERMTALAAELERARRLLLNGTPPEQVLEALARGLTNKFLHAPTQALNQAGDAERAELVALFERIYRLPDNGH